MNNKLYKRALVALSCLGAVLLLSVEASATDVYQINASGTDQTNPDNGSRVITSPWSLIFDDLSGDGLVQTDEIISFSGATVTTISPDPDSVTNEYEYDELVGTPDETGISESSGEDLFAVTPCCWWFDGPVTAATPELPFDGWFPRRWTYEKIQLLDSSSCDVPVGIDAVMTNLMTGFTVDPLFEPQPPIVLASLGLNIRGFVDLERSDIISTQCDSDYFAIYAWFGAGDGSDLTEVNDFFASLGTLQFLIDGDPVTNIVTDASAGYRPSLARQPSGIIVAGYIVQPFELAPGLHVASLVTGNFGPIFVTPFNVIAADADGDGVNDSFDLCPNTPPDAAVDINGCTSDEAAELTIEEIDALLADPSLSDKAGKNLGKAQDKLGDALAELAGGDIKKALKKVGDAAKELLKAEKEGADVGGLVDQLIVLAETQARRAVDAAIAAGGDPKEIGKAEKELGKADDELAKGKPDKAIDRYAKAWDHARKA